MRLHLILLSLPLLAFVSCQKETEVERANREGIFLIGNSAEPKSLDHQLVTGVPESKITGALFEGLAGDHPSEDSTMLPGAAESWSHNEGLTEWIFKLQPEGKWSDGVPVTAHDFVFAYRRLLTPEFAAPYVDMLYFIENAEEFNKEEIKDFSKVGVKAVDDLTLLIKLKEPVPFLPALTRHYTWFPVPEHAVLKHGSISDRFTDWCDLDNLVGNGPFMLKEWRFHDKIEVERNPYYWDAEAVGLNGIRFLPIENPYTEARAFLAGQLHSMYQLPPDLIQSIKETNPDYLRQEPYVGTTFVRINNTRPVLSDPRVRKALSLCIDREEMCKYIMEGFTPATSFTPKMGEYEPTPKLAFDPEQARALLAEAGFPDGKGFPRFSMLISKPSARSTAEAYQAMWKKHLNILIDIESMDWGSYNTAQQNLNFDLSAAGWIGDYLDPTTFLNMWTKGNGNNNTGWGNEKYEALLSKAAQEADAAQRLEILKQAEEVLMDEQPILPVSFYSRNYLHRPEVKGWHPLLLDNHPWKLLSLEP
jgi:oligopeptide transport system substrate-binding protein